MIFAQPIRTSFRKNQKRQKSKKESGVHFCYTPRPSYFLSILLYPKDLSVIILHSIKQWHPLQKRNTANLNKHSAPCPLPSNIQKNTSGFRETFTSASVLLLCRKTVGTDRFSRFHIAILNISDEFPVGNAQLATL